MTSTFISLTIIALVAAVVPLIAKLIPKQLVPEPVLLIGAGAALGPHAMAVIHSNSEAIVLLSDLGCAFLFLLAGYEINPKALVGTDGKKGFATWVVTFLIGLGVAFIMPNIASGKQGLIATALLLTTTALGALMPILKERDITNTRVGELVIAYGTWGELATVLAVAILLSARTTWKTAIILGVLFLLCLWISMVGTKAVAMNSRLYRFIKSKAETTSQTIMRVTILLVIVLVAFSSAFDLDIVLGAFAAGFVLRFITAEANKTLEIKLNGLAHGFSIPLFFVISGCGIDFSQSPPHYYFFVLGKEQAGNSQSCFRGVLLHHSIASNCSYYRYCSAQWRHGQRDCIGISGSRSHIGVFDAVLRGSYLLCCRCRAIGCRSGNYPCP